jgi:type I restriction enzyme, S subunit
MSKGTNRKVVPKLRFPEFRNDSEWVVKELGEITYTVGERNREGKKYPIYSINNVEGFLPQSDQFEGVDSHSRGYDVSLYKLIGKNTFAYNPARINVGSIGYSSNLQDIIISSLYVCFKTTGALDDLFLLQYLKTKEFNQSVKQNVEGGIRSYLFYENFSRIKLSLPLLNEQQKIASCLSSLDELITAECQKLNALKAHKRALMQQLFPAEGETVPRLRFAEFRNSGDWQEKTLSEVADYENGKAHEQDIVEAGDFIVVNSKFISTDGEVKKFTNTPFCLAKTDDILMVLSDVPNGRAIAKCFYVDAESLYTVNQRICRITPKEAIGKFLFYILDRDSYFLSFDDGVKQTNLRKEDVLNCPLFLPTDPREQQSIANCLNALDRLIVSHAEKMQALKLHKKGLMQQLFPQMSESASDQKASN